MHVRAHPRYGCELIYSHARSRRFFFFFCVCVCVCVRGGPPYSHALVHVWLLTRCLRALQPRCSCASSLSSFAERVRLSLVAPSWRFAHVHMWFVFCLARCSDIMTRRQVYGILRCTAARTRSFGRSCKHMPVQWGVVVFRACEMCAYEPPHSPTSRI